MILLGVLLFLAFLVAIALAPEPAVRFGLVAAWVALAAGCAASVGAALLR